MSKRNTVEKPLSPLREHTAAQPGTVSFKQTNKAGRTTRPPSPPQWSDNTSPELLAPMAEKPIIPADSSTENESVRDSLERECGCGDDVAKAWINELERGKPCLENVRESTPNLLLYISKSTDGKTIPDCHFQEPQLFHLY